MAGDTRYRDLLERESELEALGDVLSAPESGQGRVVIIEGAAGAGKSALVRETVAAAREVDLTVLRARGGEMERNQPYGLIRQLLEPALARLDPESRRDVASGAAAPAARVLSPQAEPVADGFVAATAIFWLVSNLAERAPLLIAVDDAHWGDASSLGALEHLARRIEDLPVVLLFALRPAEPDAPAQLLDALRQAPNALQLAPAPLSLEAISALLSDRWPETPAPVVDAVRLATGGNPLLLTELLRTLDRGVTPTADAVASAALPTLEERVLRRVSRMGPTAPALARAIAIFGDGVRLADAAELAGIDPGEARSVAHGLRRIEVLGSEDPASFVHPLVRQSIYEGMPDGERNDLHARAAELLLANGAPPEVAVVHLSALPVAQSSDVASLHLRAAEAALRRAAPAEAVAWLERAIAEEAPEPARGELLARLGLAQATLHDPSFIEALDEAYGAIDDPELKCAVAVELAYGLAISGAWERSAALIERAARDLADVPAAVADIAAVRSTLELHDSRRRADFDAHRPALERFARHGEDWGSEAAAVILASEAAFTGHTDTAREAFTLALRGGRVITERGGGGWAVPMLLGLPLVLDELDQAEVLIGEVERAARASGSALATVFALISRAWLRARRGDLSGAEVDLTTVLALGQETGFAMLVANVALYLIDVLIERPAAAPAVAVIEHAPVPEEFLPTWSGAMMIEARGRLRLARGDRDAAIADLRTAGATADALRFGPVISGWRCALALALGHESPEEALALAQEDLTLARASGLARPQGIALRTLGILHGNDAVGIAYLRQSVAILADGPSPLEHARSLIALGGALRRTKQGREARAVIGTGLEMAITCGAERLRAEAEDELVAAGGRRRRSDQTGIESLTASELRVARLAASELSNVQIAQTLYVSVKTVETHLAHVYAKLGLAGSGSRWRLARALGDGSPLTGGRVP